MNSLAAWLAAARLAVAVVAGLALGAAIRHNTAREEDAS